MRELSRLVAQPSVGGQNLGIQDCAAMVPGMFETRGFEVRVNENICGNPVLKHAPYMDRVIKESAG